jgi:L-glyceraldehyde 3-phosphate reductase
MTARRETKRRAGYSLSVTLATKDDAKEAMMSDLHPAYDKMSYKRCGRSGLKLPQISLGLWHNFGGAADHDNGRHIVRAAFELGITHFDLANNYGPPPGSAEYAFGEILKSDLAAHRDEIIISTKAGYHMWNGPYGEWGSRKYMLASLDQSLKRMGVDYVDIFYSHRFDPDTLLEETMGALDTAVRQGKALYAGISSYSARDTRQAAAILRRLGAPCLIHQPQYSMFNRTIEGDNLLDALDTEGIGSIVFSPLAQGMLTNKYLGGVPEGSRASSPGFFPQRFLGDDMLARVKGLNAIAKARGQSLAQMALAWVLRGGKVTSALIGASSAQQVKECVGALAALKFTPDELTEIDKHAARVGEAL